MKQNDDLTKCIRGLLDYVEQKDYTGYDIYDGLNITGNKFLLHNYFFNTLLTQGFKKFPLNLRGLLGMKETKMPKAIGIFLNCYCNLARTAPDDPTRQQYLDKARKLKDWLKENKSNKYSGYSWPFGFNYKFMFDEPTVVITSIIAKGLYNYYELTSCAETREMLMGTATFILENLPVTETKDGICYSYTAPEKDCCYNASLLAAETLARVYAITKDPFYEQKIFKAVDFIIAHQHKDGRWNYSINPETGIERPQVDFHQGYVLESLYEIVNLTGNRNPTYIQAIKKGLQFYFENQFFKNGRAKWRIPAENPADIHNQAQGIITFAMMHEFDEKYLPFSETIFKWTLNNMYDEQGFFYYQVHPLYKNKIPYMRWAQAWMLLSLTVLHKQR